MLATVAGDGEADMVDQVVSIRFQAQDSGEDDLTWGQGDLWEAMRRMGTWLPIGGVRPLGPGASVDSVADGLQFLLQRHQSLRTRLRIGAGGRARQVVAGSGEVPLELVEAAPGDDPAKVAEQVAQRFRSDPYDFTTDWPVRLAVIRQHGRLTHQVMIMCHLVTDAAGAKAMAADLAARDPRTSADASPVTGLQPLAQARWQRSPAGQRLSEAALRHWEHWLRTIPPDRFADATGARRPRYWQVGFRSPAMFLAVRAYAERTGAAVASVLMTLFAVALTRTSGVNPAVTRVLVNNRFRPGLASVVAPLTHAGLLVVDVEGTTVDEALTATRRRALATYKYAYYDPYRMLELVERVGRERGEPVDIGCFLNDRRMRPDELADAPVPTREQVRSALPLTRLRCEVQQDEPLERLFVHVNDSPDAVDLTVLTDTHYLPPATLEAFLRCMEDVAVAAAFDPSARC
jgi:hypothetical protein